jgi:metabotropic X receptor
MMLFTIDYVNEVMGRGGLWIPGVRLGAHVLDDCDKDTYGLEQAVDFIKGTVKMHQALVRLG